MLTQQCRGKNFFTVHILLVTTKVFPTQKKNNLACIEFYLCDIECENDETATLELMTVMMVHGVAYTYFTSSFF